jgi:Undecaprenyl-phosphate glucose phosphotransferase
MWFFLGVGDIFHINLSFLAAYLIRFDSFQLPDPYVFLLLIFNLIWLVVAAVFRLYDFDRVSRIEDILASLFKAGAVHVLVITTLLFSLKASDFSREHLLYTYGINFVLLAIWRLFAMFLLKRYRRSGYNYRNVVIVGTGSISEQLYNFFHSGEPHGYRLLSIFYEDAPKRTFSEVSMSDLKDLKEFCLREKVDEIYYTMSITDKDMMNDLILFSDNNMIRLRIIPDFRSFLYRKVNVSLYADIPVITLRDEPLQDELNRLLKRLFDIIVSSLVILLIYPWLMPVVALLVKLSSKGPVFFKQLRSGINNRDFYCYKFRTMRMNADADKLQATKGDPRITKIGAFLRKSNLDEFPQFLNVFFGDMSIVGPRPHMVKHTDDYSKLIDKYMVRQLVKPGITGAAQVYGFRGETKTTEEMEKRVQMDVWYIENWSLLLDMKLMVLTVWNMLKGEEKAY